jgi:AcrR family transcriptional regulator
MGRTARHHVTTLLLGARALLDSGVSPADLTIKAVSERARAPVGSIYYRFPSRAALLAELWLDAAGLFQRELAAHAADTSSAGALAAWPIAWCRRHPSQARILLVLRREELLVPGTPERLLQRARALGKELGVLHRRLARRLLGGGGVRQLAAVRLALAAIPLAALREPLRLGKELEPELEEWVAAAAEAVVARAKEVGHERRRSGSSRRRTLG